VQPSPDNKNHTTTDDEITHSLKKKKLTVKAVTLLVRDNLCKKECGGSQVKLCPGHGFCRLKCKRQLQYCEITFIRGVLIFVVFVGRLIHEINMRSSLTYVYCIEAFLKICYPMKLIILKMKNPRILFWEPVIFN